jgi:hypothetical protein
MAAEAAGDGRSWACRSTRCSQESNDGAREGAGSHAGMATRGGASLTAHGRAPRRVVDLERAPSSSQWGTEIRDASMAAKNRINEARRRWAGGLVGNGRHPRVVIVTRATRQEVSRSAHRTLGFHERSRAGSRHAAEEERTTPGGRSPPQRRSGW